MTFKRISLLFVFSVLSACATKPTKIAADFPQARWDTKMRITELAKEKTQSVNVAVLGVRKGPIRLEASAIIGIPVASYVMNQNGFRCAVYGGQKVFYEGGLSEASLKPLLKFALSPVVLKNIIFDEVITGGDWKCARGADGQVTDCRSQSRKLAVTWARIGALRSVKVMAPGYQLDWDFGVAQTEVQFKDGTFNLEAPSGFRVIHL